MPAQASEPKERNHIGFFLGSTHTADGDDAFSIGAEYEYLLIPQLGIGVLGEYATGPIDTWIIGAPLTWHVAGGLQLVAMPAVEMEGGESRFLFRVGAGYEFELDKFTIKPEVNADFVDGEVDVVFGATFGFGF